MILRILRSLIALGTAPSPASRAAAPLRTSAFAALLLFSGCFKFVERPADLDFARTRVSEAAHFRGTIRPAGDSIPRGKLQTWTLHVETLDGVPIDSAQISVDGGMPQHGHGLPTRPIVTRRLGAGDHLVEGLKFNMSGWWVVTFRVRTADTTDVLAFNVML